MPSPTKKSSSGFMNAAEYRKQQEMKARQELKNIRKSVSMSSYSGISKVRKSRVTSVTKSDS